jgi:hypothetical protein
MTPSLREQFERLGLRLNELDASLADPQVSADIKRYRALSREQAEVAGLVERCSAATSSERPTCRPHGPCSTGTIDETWPPWHATRRPAQATSNAC